MDNYLEKVENDLIQEVEKISARDIAKQQKLQCRYEALSNEIKRFQNKQEQCKDNFNMLFVTSKQIQKKLQRCHEINEEISSQSQINTLKYIPSEELKDMKMHNICLGNLDRQVKKFSGRCIKCIIDMKSNFVKKIDVQTKAEKDCYITGMTIISEAEIILADNFNVSFKVLTHKEGKITSFWKTSSPPADFSTINSSSAATTLPDEGKIMFINTQNGLSVSHSLQVWKRCYGIDHQNGLMAVVFAYPPAVQVSDMEGHILHQVSDTSILKDPIYVSLGNDNESMYVSDWKNNAVYDFTLTGHLKTTITNKRMNCPVGLTVTNCGNLAVCDPNKCDYVSVILLDTRECLPLYVQNVLTSCTLLLCEEQGNMFISEYLKSKDRNYIKEYDLITQ